MTFKKKLFFTVTNIAIVTFTLFGYDPQSAEAIDKCASIRFVVNDVVQQPGASIKTNPGNRYSLQLRIDQERSPGVTCDVPSGSNPWDYIVRSQTRDLNPDPREGDTTTAPIELDSGTFAGQRSYPWIKHIALGQPSNNTEYNYTFAIRETRNGTTAYPDTSVRFLDSGGSGTTTTTPPATGYTPTNVTVCNLGSTTATICWKTTLASNTEVEYGEKTTTEKEARFTDFTKLDHSAPLTSLKPGTKYKYRARSSPNAGTTSTKSEEFTFTTKNADGTGGDTGGQSNSNNPPTKPVNTAVGVNFNIDLDEPIGTFWNPLQKQTLPQLITGLIRILFALIGIVAVIIIIISGFRMVLANGSESQLKDAKAAITWAILGLIVSLLAFSIVAIIQRLIQVGANS